MKKSPNILIIGAGIAGPAACYWLKKFGFSPVLIEKAEALRKGGQALDIRGVATQLTKTMGIYDQLCEKRTRIEHGRFIDTAGNVLHEEHGETFGFRQDDEIEILRGDLANILMNIIPDVPCYFNQTIINLEQNNDGVIVNFQNGRTEHYDLIIAADGIHSATRRMLFNPDEYQLSRLGAYISTFTIPNYLGLNHTDLECESHNQLVSLNSDHDPELARASFMFRSQHVLKDIRDENEQKQFLQDTFKNFGWEAPTILKHMLASDDFYFDSVMQVKMKHWAKGRVVLLGDAGYCPSPLSGQGNNLALIGAYILAGELKLAHGNHTEAFARYHERMRAFVETNQQFGVWVSESFFLNNTASKAMAEERSNKILSMIKAVSNGIDLPRYE